MNWIAHNPATSEEIGEIQDTPIEEIPNIMAKGREGFLQFSRLSLEERVKYLTTLRHLIVDKQAGISKTIARSTGKIVTEALTTEVMVVTDAILHAEKRTKIALSPKRIKTPITFIGKSSYVEYKPRGVVVVISPWNFPFMLAMIPAIEALAAGNAVIIKPSEVTPMVGILIESLFNQLGLPEGVAQVVHGGKEIGEELIRSRPAFIHFTGSVKTGKAIQAAVGSELIPTTLELGGKDPMIVFEDANIKRAVSGAIWGAFSNSGQVCMSVERVYVQRSIFHTFVDMLVDEAMKLRIGNGQDDDIGSMTTARQVEIVKRHVSEALARGATLLTGEPPDNWDPDSMYLKPMVLIDVKQDMAVMQEETFGPVLPVMPFDTEQEAIDLANDSRFGLNSSVWTSDIPRGKRVISQLITGGALLNDVILTIANPYLPYGGVKDSGLGSYHADTALQNFCLQTSVMVDRGKKLREVNWFPYGDKGKLFEDLLRSYWGNNRNLIRFGTSYLKLLIRSRKR